MRIQDVLSDADLEEIRAAAAAAEERTAGEIVPYLVDRVDPHGEARWKATALGALVASLLAAGLNAWIEPWGAPWTWIVLPPWVGAALGMLAARMPGIERALIDRDVLAHRAELRAHVAFLEAEVFQTRDRTGILIFIAFFEHQAMLLADTGILEKVDEAVWNELAAELAAGMREGRVKEALLATIARCGALLEEGGVARRADDVNELADAPRVKER